MRRLWVLCVTVPLVAGTATAASHAMHRYAQARAVLLVVPPTVPADQPPATYADGAQRLAATYAALIPDDEDLLSRVARQTGLDESLVSDVLSAANPEGTAIIELTARARAPQIAMRVVGATAQQVVRRGVGGRGIGATTQVRGAALEPRSGGSGVVQGVALGILLGVLLMATLERSDRRIDAAANLAAASGVPSFEPATMSDAALAAVLERWAAVGARSPSAVVLVAAGSADAATLADVTNVLVGAGRTHGVAVADAVEDGAAVVLGWADRPAALPSSAALDAMIVLVALAGDRVRAVAAAASALEALGRPAAWALLGDTATSARKPSAPVGAEA